jgi:hypothetical protein
MSPTPDAGAAGRRPAPEDVPMPIGESVPEDPEPQPASAVDPSMLDAGGFLTRDAILAIDDVRYDVVDVSRWWGPGAKVRIRSLTGRERDAYDMESWRMTEGGKDAAAAMTDFRVRRVARAIVGADGLPVFDARDIRAFGEKNGAAIDYIDDAVVALSGMTPASQQKAVEDLKGGPSGGSGTA